MKPGAHFKEACYAPLDADSAQGGRSHLREYLEQRTLPGAIAADNTEDLPVRDGEAHVIQGPELMPDQPRMVLLGNLDQGVGFVTDSGPPAGNILLQRGPANHSEPVSLAHVFD